MDFDDDLDWQTTIIVFFVLVIFCPVILCYLYRLMCKILARIPWGWEVLDEPLRKRVDFGIKFTMGSVLSLIGIGKGSELLETSEKTKDLIAYLGVLGILSYASARIAYSGVVFRLSGLVGMISSLSIMAIASLHFRFPNEFGVPLILLCVFYVLCLSTWKCMSNHLNDKKIPVIERPKTKALEKMAEDVVTITTTFGLGLIAVGAWGDQLFGVSVNHETLLRIAESNGMAFLATFGAQLLEAGMLYESLMWVAYSFFLSTPLTALCLVLFSPGLEYIVLFFCALFVTIWLKSPSIDRWIFKKFGKAD